MARPLGRKNLSPKEIYGLVCKYVDVGNYSEMERETGINRKVISDRVNQFIREKPDEYNKILDTFMLRNKQQMILQNTYTTKKALEKVGELLEDTDSLRDATIAYGTLYDKGALMKGESTSNSAIVIKMAGDVEELSK